MNARKLASYIDHTALKSNTTRAEIEQLCLEAREYGFMAVCVNSCWVGLCDGLLIGTETSVCSVVGFPLGAACSIAKAGEARIAIEDGATEIDMVVNVGALLSGMDDMVEDDICTVKNACADRAILKAIIETCLLTDEQKVEACTLAVAAGADFVKTSTGFNTAGVVNSGATVEDVRLMREVVGLDVGIKAAGGIKTYEDAMALINAGATRLGCSAGVAIVAGT